MSFFAELKRRNVVRVGIAYAVATWLLIQVTDIVFPRIGLPDSAVTLVIALLAIGFIPALIFAWAFEMTPEGIKREKDVDREKSITPTTGKKLDRAIIGVLVLVVAWFVFDKFYLQPNSIETTVTEAPAAVVAYDTASIAVLPFVNMSGDRENEYFSDGLTETLLHMLAQLPELRVAARTSSFAFKGKETSIGEIASTLGVAHILEGSVQKSGDRVRVTAQLIRADDGFHVWSQNYTRPLEDIFAIQDVIATDVANALDASLLGGGKRVTSVATTNLSAYDTYLKAMEQQAVFSYGSLANADSLFRQALAADPAFIDAKLGLARNHLMKFGTGLLNEAETTSLMTPLLAQVRQAQPDNPLVRALELVLQLQTPAVMEQARLEAVTDELRMLLAMLPTETYVRAIVASNISFRQQRPELALTVVEAGLIADPLSALLHNRLGQMYFELEQFEAARKSYAKALELDARDPGTYTRMGWLEAHFNNLPGKLDWFRRATKVDPQDHELAAMLAEDFYMLGLSEEGNYWAARVDALAPGSAVARRVAMQAALSRGQTELAMELAAAMIRDQVALRQDSFPEAVYTYQDEMAKAGRSQEAYDFLLSVRPELADPMFVPDDVHGSIMRWSSILLMGDFRPADEQQAAWKNLAAHMDALGIPWRDMDPINQLEEALVLRDSDRAVKIALENHLSQPLAEYLHLARVYDTPMYAELAHYPAVAARLGELNRELETMRKQVIDMLQQPEWDQAQ